MRYRQPRIYLMDKQQRQQRKEKTQHKTQNKQKNYFVCLFFIKKNKTQYYSRWNRTRGTKR